MILAERSNVNLGLLYLFIINVPLRLIYPVNMMTLISTVIDKSTFQIFSHINALGIKIIIWANFVVPTFPMVHTKSIGLLIPEKKI